MSDQTPDVTTPESMSVCTGWWQAYDADEMDAYLAALRSSLAAITAERDKYRTGFDSAQLQIGVLLESNAALRAGRDRLQDALDIAIDALNDYADVVDGPDGEPRANRAMSALAACQEHS